MQTAVTRKVSPDFDRCELTHLQRIPIDVLLAAQQHARYEAALSSLGFEVLSLPAVPGLPDSIFVEDVALVFDEMAVITRPGAVSRRAEAQLMAAVLTPYREIVSIASPGVLDGGDVLRIGHKVFVGLSSRTNADAIAQLDEFLSPLAYVVTAVPVTGCLHLKSAVTQVAERTLLINRDWVDEGFFPEWDLIDVGPEELGAANALFLGEVVVYPAAFPRTQARLERAGISVLPLDVSEILKAEGGVTCCSLIFRT